MKLLWGPLVVLALAGSACSWQAQQCCDCMATKSTIFGKCIADTMDQCVEELSKSPPNEEAISPLCRDEGSFCPDSCADVLYKK